jgi:hypothetical protein
MRTIQTFFASLFLLAVFKATAQENMEDVIYLKNGNVYRGMLIEQVPNDSYKIQITGGSIFTVTVSEVLKITKEQRWQSPYRTNADGTVVNMDKPQTNRYNRYADSSYVPHYQKKRTYFFIAELRVGPANGGVRIINGYKFNRFGYIGVGVGIDGANFTNTWNGARSISSDGVYFPLVIRYQGDILRTRITPFYYAELGYAAHPGGVAYFTTGRTYGGPLATVGFGCKFNTKRRVNFNLNLNATWRSNFFDGTIETYDEFGNLYYYRESGMDRQLFGNFCFGVGF